MAESEELQLLPRPSKPSAFYISIIVLQVIMGILAIPQLVVGAVYQKECPRQPYIPIYLLVMGVVSLLMIMLCFLLPSFGHLSKALIFIVSLFVFCWVIAGNVWIQSINEPSFNKTVSTMDTYCNKTLYLFALWTSNLFSFLLCFTICNCNCKWAIC